MKGANNAAPKTNQSNQSNNTKRDQKLIINHVNDTYNSTSSGEINSEGN